MNELLYRRFRFPLDQSKHNTFIKEEVVLFVANESNLKYCYLQTLY